MSHYSLPYSAQHLPQDHAGNSGGFLRPIGHDDRGSQSPSDDGFNLYSKSESELEGKCMILLVSLYLTDAGSRGVECLFNRSDPQY